MSEAEAQSYVVTPGPEILRKMGLSWTLFSPTGAHLATFSHGPDGEPPGSVDLTLSEEVAAELGAAGYTVEAPAGVGPEVSGPAGFGLEPDGAVMVSEPGEGVQAEPGTQADGSPAEPARRRRA